MITIKNKKTGYVFDFEDNIGNAILLSQSDTFEKVGNEKEVVVDVKLEKISELEKMTKEELETYAKEKFGMEVDKRKKKEDIIKIIKSWI
jgi:flagellar motility protein MotE (MotC chaperone)